MGMDRAVGRRAVGRILEAGGLDDLFAGSGPDAPVLRAVLADLAGGRQGRWYATGARLARRRGLTVSYAVDRAAALWSVLQARERDDLYRALGVPPLAGAGGAGQTLASPPGAGGTSRFARRAPPGTRCAIRNGVRRTSAGGCARWRRSPPIRRTARRGDGRWTVPFVRRRVGEQASDVDQRQRSGGCREAARPRAAVRVSARVAVRQMMPGNGDLDEA
jgi:hypothetical protein